MIRQGYELPDERFHELSRALMLRIHGMTADQRLTLLAMLVGDVPEAVARMILLRDKMPPSLDNCNVLADLV